MNKFQLLCKRMIDGKIPHNQNYYALDSFLKDDKVGNENIKLVTPVQSSVERAKSEIKKKGYKYHPLWCHKSVGWFFKEGKDQKVREKSY